MTVCDFCDFCDFRLCVTFGTFLDIRGPNDLAGVQKVRDDMERILLVVLSESSTVAGL